MSSGIRDLIERWGVAVAAVTLGILTLAGTFDSSQARSGGHAPRAAAPARAARATPRRPPARPAPLPPAGPTHQVAIGAYIPGATRQPSVIDAYSRGTGRPPAIVVYYRSWGGPLFDDLTLHRVTHGGAIPIVTWEPWRQPLRSIATGAYDGYIRDQAHAARRWGRPLLVRFAHEMNGDWYPWGAGANQPAAYISAWRHIVDVFRHEHANNVRFVWAPNAEHDSQRLLLSLYPGDRWVDWVALSGFDWGGPWLWESAFHAFGNSYRALTHLTKKPLMIVETAAGEVGGNKPRWIGQTFGRDLRRMPRVRAVVWFNGRAHWANWSVNSTPASLKAYRNAIASPRYSGTAADVQQLSGLGALRP